MTQKFRSFLEKELNRAQQQAVQHHTGPLLVVAGAGSGKTRVITSRITQLILNEHINPTSIVALTFTNKAAQEMKERIRTFLDDFVILPFVGTFHSYCLQILKTNAHLLKRPHFTILDGDDQQKMVSKIITRFGLTKKVSAKQLIYHISTLKNSRVPEKDEQHSIDPIVQQVYRAYEQEKELSNCFDFDDLLIEVLKLFQTNKEFKEEFQNRIRHLLVDEYQDTNVTQHELLKQMALSSKKKFVIDSLCVVGDEDQSIYSWRGATVANIINFKKDFPDASIITIDQNYRSAQPILDVANNVIKHNHNRNPKTLWSDKKGSDRIRSFSCLSGYQEADLVTTFLQLVAKLSSLSSAAVLYRAHYQSRALEEALIKHSIPYRIIGGILFYERAEIKDILAYLRLIVNPFDRVSFFRVINTPTRGLGEKFEELVYTHWNQDPFLTFKQVCKKLIDENLITTARKESVQEFIDIFDDLTHQTRAYEATERIIQRTLYLTYLKNAHDPEEARAKTENVKELLQAIQHFEEQGLNNVSSFLDEVALMQEKINSKDKNKDAVQLMTLHAAKGLEFDTVVITGLEEGLLPSSHSLQEAESIEEERRLLYVGITRARERLLLTCARYRHTFGQMEHQTPSRFWSEIPNSIIQEDCSHWQPSQIRDYCASWLNIKQQTIAPQVITFGSIARKKTFEPSIIPSLAVSVWKKNQPVQHQSFGIGIVQKIEEKGQDTTYITAKFKMGVKKVDAKFLKAI